MTSETLTLPVLPLRSGVMLPGMVFTIALETDEAKAAAEVVGTSGGRLLLVPHIDGRYGSVGVVAEVVERGELPGGLPGPRGERRAPGHPRHRGARDRCRAVGGGRAGGRDLVGRGPDRPRWPASTGRCSRTSCLSRGAGRVAAQLREVTEPGRLADLAGYSPDLTLAQKVEVLETLDVTARLALVLWVGPRTPSPTSPSGSGSRATSRRGWRSPSASSCSAASSRRSARSWASSAAPTPAPPTTTARRLAERDLPEKVREAVEREIDKLERTSEQSPEHGWIRTWLDTVLEIPWGVESEDRLDVPAAAAIFDEDHDGLDDVKERILQHLSVRKLQAERGLAPVDGRGAGAILALVGPPGVGKTSLGESVARALGRKFVRVALGGVRDEAEIRGHRRTYVGAQPGRLVRALREAGTMNPVLLLDEVDKIGADYRGDPSSALLEVLDPAQNHTFRDHYLEVDLDLSRVLFIATANVVDTIPGPLLDRMEVIRLDGYTDNEKVAIARHHLLARQASRAGLREDEVVVSDEALAAIVEDYTREAGVRSLERELGRLLRKVATKIVAGEAHAPVEVGTDDVRGWLGRPRFFFEAAEREAAAGGGHRPGRDRRRWRRAVRRGQRVRRAPRGSPSPASSGT